MEDPLKVNIQLAGVETEIPLLPEADYVVQCTESSIDPNKENIGLNWNLKLALTQSATAVDGRIVQADFPLFAVYALQAREDSKDPEAFKRGISGAVDALFVTDKDSRPEFTLELVQQAVGKVCVAHVVQDEYQGRKNNKVKSLKKLPAAAV